MADNFDPPLGAGGPNKKAGLTKPERKSPKRSLPPPPPSAVKAVQKSLPPAPPSSIDVDMDDGEEPTVAGGRAPVGFFDAEESENDNPIPAASPWALPAVAPAQGDALGDPAIGDASGRDDLGRAEVGRDGLGSDELERADHDRPGTDSPPSTLATPSEAAETQNLPRNGSSFDEPDVADKTQDVPDVEIVTSAVNEKPELQNNGAGNDLDSLVGRSSPRSPGVAVADSDPFAQPVRPSTLSGKPPPPPPSLRPPPPLATKPALPPPSLMSSAPPPPISVLAAAPAPVFAAPLPDIPPPPVAVLPEPEVPGLSASYPGSPLPAPAPPPLMSAPSHISAPLPPLAAPPLPSAPLPHSAPPPPPGSLSFHDDDVTTVFDRSGVDSIPPPPSFLQLPQPALPLPSFAPQAGPLLTFSDPAPSSDEKFYQKKPVIAALAAALFIGVLTLFLWPSAGRLVVAVAGPNGTIVDGIQVTVDDKIVCTSSPCQVEDLEAKSYLVSVTAEGFEKTAPQAVIVRAGEDAVHNVTLNAPIVAAPTGLDIPGDSSFTLSVDGKEIGSLPQKVLDLTPGEHVLRISGGDRYVPEEKRVTLVEGQVISLQPFSLEVKRGRAIIEAGSNAEEATVRLDGKAITLPHKTDLDPTKKHRLIASRDGYLDFVEEIEFPPGKAERTFTVALESNGEAGEATLEAEAEPAKAASTPSGRSRSSAGAASSSAGAAKGTLNITSSPSAMVILDGRPIGKTPRMGVKVSPGAHSIVFVSDKGRKRATTKVAAGASKTVNVRF